VRRDKKELFLFVCIRVHPWPTILVFEFPADE
jgi:hypothetical protein